MVKAAEYGLHVSKPISANSHYDVALEHEGHFLRVQVKSTMHYDHGTYVCKTPFDPSGRKRYVAVDFVAAYVIPEDAWYILPSRVTERRRGNIALEPTKKGQKYKQYLEAWHLLRRASQRGAKNKNR
jgi:PD-(D/E)XK endonuclease